MDLSKNQKTSFPAFYSHNFPLLPYLLAAEERYHLPGDRVLTRAY
jgi:hypothetical protein